VQRRALAVCECLGGSGGDVLGENSSSSNLTESWASTTESSCLDSFRRGRLT
jgi:hypothetical protein